VDLTPSFPLGGLRDCSSRRTFPQPRWNLSPRMVHSRDIPEGWVTTHKARLWRAFVPCFSWQPPDINLCRPLVWYAISFPVVASGRISLCVFLPLSLRHFQHLGISLVTSPPLVALCVVSPTIRPPTVEERAPFFLPTSSERG